MNGQPPARRRNGGRLLAHIAVVIGLAAVAAAAFALSYAAVRDIALAADVPAALARLYPALFDAVFVLACAAALTLREARWWARAYAWLSVLVTGALIAAAAAYHAMGLHLPHKTAAGIVAALPLALVVLGFSLWLSMLRHGRAGGSAAAADTPAPAQAGPSPALAIEPGRTVAVEPASARPALPAPDTSADEATGSAPAHEPTSPPASEPAATPEPVATSESAAKPEPEPEPASGPNPVAAGAMAAAEAEAAAEPPAAPEPAVEPEPMPEPEPAAASEPSVETQPMREPEPATSAEPEPVPEPAVPEPAVPEPVTAAEPEPAPAPEPVPTPVSGPAPAADAAAEAARAESAPDALTPPYGFPVVAAPASADDGSGVPGPGPERTPGSAEARVFAGIVAEPPVAPRTRTPMFLSAPVPEPGEPGACVPAPAVNGGALSPAVPQSPGAAAAARGRPPTPGTDLPAELAHEAAPAVATPGPVTRHTSDGSPRRDAGQAGTEQATTEVKARTGEEPPTAATPPVRFERVRSTPTPPSD